MGRGLWINGAVWWGTANRGARREPFCSTRLGVFVPTVILERSGKVASLALNRAPLHGTRLNRDLTERRGINRVLKKGSPRRALGRGLWINGAVQWGTANRGAQWEPFCSTRLGVFVTTVPVPFCRFMEPPIPWTANKTNDDHVQGAGGEGSAACRTQDVASRAVMSFSVVSVVQKWRITTPSSMETGYVSTPTSSSVLTVTS